MRTEQQPGPVPAVCTGEGISPRVRGLKQTHVMEPQIFAFNDILACKRNVATRAALRGACPWVKHWHHGSRATNRPPQRTAAAGARCRSPAPGQGRAVPACQINPLQQTNAHGETLLPQTAGFAQPCLSLQPFADGDSAPRQTMHPTAPFQSPGSPEEVHLFPQLTWVPSPKLVTCSNPSLAFSRCSHPPCSPLLDSQPLQIHRNSNLFPLPTHLQPLPACKVN